MYVLTTNVKKNEGVAFAGISYKSESTSPVRPMAAFPAFHQFSLCRKFRKDAIGCRRWNTTDLMYISILDNLVAFEKLLDLFLSFCCFIFRRITHSITHIDSFHERCFDCGKPVGEGQPPHQWSFDWSIQMADLWSYCASLSAKKLSTDVPFWTQPW